MLPLNYRLSLVVLMIILLLGITAVTVMAQGGENTMLEQNKALIAEYFEAISGKEKPAEVQDEYISDRDQAITSRCLRQDSRSMS